MRWLLLPAILGASGAAGGVAWDLLALERFEFLALGTGFGLGTATALALVRRRWLRLLLAPATTFAALVFAFAMQEALRDAGPPDVPTWIRNLTRFPTSLLTLAPPLAFVLCLSVYEETGGRRAVLLAPPFAGWGAATLASLAGGWGAHQIYALGGALIGAALALGFAFVLALSKRLRR